jgi:hypothetical protein
MTWQAVVAVREQQAKRRGSKRPGEEDGPNPKAFAFVVVLLAASDGSSVWGWVPMATTPGPRPFSQESRRLLCPHATQSQRMPCPPTRQ